MGEINEKIITRISSNGEVEYGIPISQDLAALVDFVAESMGVSFDEAAKFLIQKGIEVTKHLEQLRQIDARLKFRKN